MLTTTRNPKEQHKKSSKYSFRNPKEQHNCNKYSGSSNILNLSRRASTAVLSSWNGAGPHHKAGGLFNLPIGSLVVLFGISL